MGSSDQPQTFGCDLEAPDSSTSGTGSGRWGSGQGRNFLPPPYFEKTYFPFLKRANTLFRVPTAADQQNSMIFPGNFLSLFTSFVYPFSKINKVK